jgi:hypothetical protein
MVRIYKRHKYYSENIRLQINPTETINISIPDSLGN